MYNTVTVASNRSAALVVAISSDKEKSRPRSREQDRPRGFKAEAGETAPRPDGSILVGLGPRADLTPAVLRKVGAKLVRSLEKLEVTAARLDAKSFTTDSISPSDAGGALGEGIGIGHWRFDTLDGSATNRAPRARSLALSASDSKLSDALRGGLALASAVNYARSLAATPPNICTPSWIAAQARALAKTASLRVRVIDFAEAKRLGMGGLVSVGQASAHKPCLVILEHRGAARRKTRRTEGPIVLVGKTITYDTGGYSLKVNNTMKGMKYDKCGGTAVLGAMKAIAEAALPSDVVALLPCAENMVSGDSYRPDDIIRMHNGASVEVTNTDAEGRLVLADALSYACRVHRPQAIVDLATLTGGVVVALGSFCAGLFCNDDDLRGRLDTASARSGERVWRLPLWPEHREHMRAQHADILNSHPKKEAHPIQGAAFLSYFVDPKVPWAHLDIAGVSDTDTASDLCCAGPTGWGVRLLFEYVSASIDVTRR